jgi:hypothetical protein
MSSTNPNASLECKREAPKVADQLDSKNNDNSENPQALSLPSNDPDLVVCSVVDKDLVCSICLSLLTKPRGNKSCVFFVSNPPFSN